MISPFVSSLTQPLVRPLVEAIGGELFGGFNPRNLFAANEPGYLLINDITTMFQDAGGLTPAVIDGPVGLWLDQSGNGFHFNQSDNALRPILRQDESGRLYLEVSGGKRLAKSGINLSGGDKFTVIIGCQKDSDATTGYVWNHGVSGAGYMYVYGPADAATPNFRFELSGSSGATAWRAATYQAPYKAVISCKFDLAGADRTTEIVPRINGATPTLTAAGAVAGGGNLANGASYFGGTGTASTNFTGRLYGLIGIGRILSASELSNGELWMENRTFSPPAVAAFRNLAANTVDIYLPARDTASSDFVKYRLYRHVAADSDNWSISGVWEASLTRFGQFTQGKRLIPEQVELMCALQEQGASDFMGGHAHGDEVVTATPTLTVGGNAVSLASGANAWFYGSSAVFSQTSRLYRVGSSLGTPLAERQVQMTFSGRDITTDQTITHLDSYTLSNGYLAMMAPHRYESYVGGISEDATSTQISGTLIDNVRLTPVDCSARAVSAPEDYVQTTPRITELALSGTYGVNFELEVTAVSDAVLKDVHFLQKNNYAYNKAYIGFIGGYSGNQAVTNATVWTISTRHRIGR